MISGREPGETLAGEEIRKLLQHPEMPKLNSRTEMLLYIAAGIEFFEQTIRPCLIEGEIFISDRWRDSTEAYQGFGLGIDREIIQRLTNFSCDGAYPDLTFLIDVDPKIGLENVSGNEFTGHKRDKIESRDLEYHERVNEGFRKIAKENPKRFRVIPYRKDDVSSMHEQIREYTKSYIESQDLGKNLLRKT